MTSEKSDPDRRAQLLAEAATIERAMQDVAHEVVRLHKQAGVPLVVWEDGRVIMVPADQIRVFDIPSMRPSFE